MSRRIQGDRTFIRKGYVESLSSKAAVVWNKEARNKAMNTFQKMIEHKYCLTFSSYWDFHKWSVKNFPDFWKEIWNFFCVISSKPYEQVYVRTGNGFLDNEWFKGAAFNYAENMLRIKDDTVALICLDEFGNEETVTFAEMYQEVALYAAAFRKHGLRIGDRIGCCMSNRKEAVFAMLAATSIGAIFGGLLPFYGARAAEKTLKIMDPKIIISVNHCQEHGKRFSPINNLAMVFQNLPGLEKVVIVTAMLETSSRDISHIPNGILLEDFLNSGRDGDGQVPELVFEQLPFNHPISINFTSGTTGLPKGITHSAGSSLPVLVDFAFHLNLKESDIVYNYCPPGWSVWDYLVQCLSLGLTLFLFAGCPSYRAEGNNIWNVLSKYKISYAFLSQAYADIMENQNIFPDPDSNFDNLKTITLGASPVKPRSYDYIRKAVKKDVFIGGIYGVTESSGYFTGFDFCLPSHKGVCQIPALGVNLQCFNPKGKPVVGERGEMVITTPSPTFCIGLWGDKDNVKMHETYLSRFKGVWCQNDEGWINPNTGGIVVVGRSDGMMRQWAEIIGACDIYFAIDRMEEIEDSVCVDQERWDSESRMVLFVKLRKGYIFTSQIREKICQTIEEELTVDYVPHVVIPVPDIPYNLNNKKLEVVVRKMVETNTIPDVSSIRNPDCLDHFCNITELVNYNKR